MKYKVVAYGNIKGECGWEVNDAHYMGIEIELPEEASKADIVKALKSNVLAKHCQNRWLEIDNENPEITIRQRSSGKWLWALQPVSEPQKL